MLASTRAGLARLSREALVTPVASGAARGHFLTFRTQQAAAMQHRLMARDIIADVRGDRIRFGFGCYHTRAEIEGAAGLIKAALEP